MQEVLESTKTCIFVSVNPNSNKAKLLFAILFTRFSMFKEENEFILRGITPDTILRYKLSISIVSLVNTTELIVLNHICKYITSFKFNRRTVLSETEKTISLVALTPWYTQRSKSIGPDPSQASAYSYIHIFYCCLNDTEIYGYSFYKRVPYLTG